MLILRSKRGQHPLPSTPPDHAHIILLSHLKSFPFACILKKYGGFGPASDEWNHRLSLGLLLDILLVRAVPVFPSWSLGLGTGAGPSLWLPSAYRCLIPGKHAHTQTHSLHLNFQKPARAVQEQLLFI